jgi:hypothetical protein
MNLNKEQKQYLHHVIKIQTIVNIKMQSILHDLDLLHDSTPFKQRMKQLYSIYLSIIKSFSTMTEIEIDKVMVLLDNDTRDEYMRLVKFLDDITEEIIPNKNEWMDKNTQKDS